MERSHIQTKARNKASEDAVNKAAQIRQAKAFKKNSGHTPVHTTLELLAAMGVNRGIRFLDSFGKIIFGSPYSRQQQR